MTRLALIIFILHFSPWSRAADCKTSMEMGTDWLVRAFNRDSSPLPKDGDRVIVARDEETEVLFNYAPLPGGGMDSHFWIRKNGVEIPISADFAQMYGNGSMARLNFARTEVAIDDFTSSGVARHRIFSTEDGRFLRNSPVSNPHLFMDFTRALVPQGKPQGFFRKQVFQLMGLIDGEVLAQLESYGMDPVFAADHVVYKSSPFKAAIFNIPRGEIVATFPMLRSSQVTSAPKGGYFVVTRFSSKRVTIRQSWDGVVLFNGSQIGRIGSDWGRVYFSDDASEVAVIYDAGKKQALVINLQSGQVLLHQEPLKF